MRTVTTEEGAAGNTVKFIRQPRQGKVIGKVSVIMFTHEIPDGDVEALKNKFQDNWKATVREFGLDVDQE